MATFKDLAVFCLLFAVVLGLPDERDADLPPPSKDCAKLDPPLEGHKRDLLLDQMLKSVSQVRDVLEPEEVPPVDTYDPSLDEEFGVTSEGSPGGAIYIRWGSRVCRGGSRLIYSGTAAGSNSVGPGSGANYLCMPDEPIYDQVEESAHNDRARLFSSEYQTNTGPMAFRSVHDNTPTCAVCRAPSDRTTKLMVPARNVCPSASWRREYKGYLMAARYSQYKSEYICMDKNMDPEPGTEGNQDGALFYFVESRCQVGGGLPCGPYVHGYELTCAVCTI